ncbi:MAG TPA: hypothetical protein PK402_02510, partial [Tepidisphaeraceae bacterium]|nr:hypothetical protein [Tepidisphaeraceae bacterium]
MSSRRVSSQHITRAIVLALASASISNAAVTLTGDTNPTNPASINSSTNLIVGQNSLGTMTVNGGSSISTANGFLGYDVGADGQVTLNGSSSSWINSNALMVARQEGSSGTLSVSHGALVSTSGLLLDAGLFSTAIATFDGEGTLLASNEVRLGQSGDGTLKFLNGAQGTTLNLVTAGLTFGSHYDIQITGANSKWTTGQVRLSDNGSGSLLISNGGVMDSIKAELISQQQPSSTNIKIDGAGSLWKINGAFKTLVGETTIEVLNGGSLVTGNTQLAVEIENPTNVRLNGPGSSWAANGSIYNQNGTMRIENIANVSCNYFDVSSTDTVQSTVITGAGSSLEVLTQLWVGRTKHTELRVENGGQLATVNTNVGGDSGYNGLITITGANSNWFAFGSTGIGDRLGASALTIANGGRFDAHGNITLAEFTNGAGTINLNGGTLNAHGRYIIFGLGTGTVNFNSGRLEHVSQYTLNLVQNG